MRKLLVIFFWLIVASVNSQELQRLAGTYVPTLSGVTNGYVLTNDNGTAQWQAGGGGGSNYWTSSGDYLYNNTGSYVGIGTSTPQGILDVVSGGARFYFDDGIKYGQWGFNGGDDYIGIYGGGSYSDHYLQLTVGDNSYYKQYNNRFTFNSGDVYISNLAGSGTGVATIDNDGKIGFSSSAPNAWSLTGNAGITGTNYIGTSDSNKLEVKVNGTSRMTFFADGQYEQQLHGFSPIYGNGNQWGYIDPSSNITFALSPLDSSLIFETNATTIYGSPGQLRISAGDPIAGLRFGIYNTAYNGGGYVRDTRIGVTNSEDIDSLNGWWINRTSIEFRTHGILRVRFDSNGAITIKDGTEGAGKVLTSDSTGNASWQSPDSTLDHYEYKALLTQTGTDDPVATVLGKNTIGNILWTRGASGYYVGALVGGFVVGKTGFIIQPPSNSLCDGFFTTDHITTDEIGFAFVEKTTGTCDGVLDNTMIEIKVYK